MKAIFLLTFLLPTLALAAPCSIEEFLPKVCLTNVPQKIEPQEVEGLPCEPIGNAPLLEQELRTAFQLAPNWMKTRLCSLDKMGIYPPLDGMTVMSWAYPHKNFLGVSRRFLEAGNTFGEIQKVMRKHALSKKNLDGAFPEGFGFSYKSPHSPVALGLLYAMAHEVGHLVYHGDRKKFATCALIFGTWQCPEYQTRHWGALSWMDQAGYGKGIAYGTARPEYESLANFVNPRNTSTVKPSEIEQFFREFLSSPFGTAFGLYSPEEDFCEVVATQVMAPNLDKWIFQFSDGSTYDFRERILNPAHPLMRKKLEFMNGAVEAPQP